MLALPSATEKKANMLFLHVNECANYLEMTLDGLLLKID